ncbi:putative defense protein 3 [Dendronephthya gigantea]|uniref:putative defense protein 3 n=1 Tax=Dendronephthya gigantea TaxID=151771 RepID=UPI00106B8764|nr:putative defense protein 3 [Dendronephthya gigantea]
MNKLIVLCVFIILFYKHANALPGGAPSQTCISMTPSPTKHGQPQKTDAPYVIQVDKSYYAVNDTVKVYIKSCKDGMEIAGFLIQAREENSNKPLGQFSKIPENTRHLDCTADNADTERAAVTQMRTLTQMPKKMLMFEWKPTEMTSGKIQFVATILKDRPTFWLRVKSVVLEKKTHGMNYTMPNNDKCPGKNSSMTTTPKTNENGSRDMGTTPKGNSGLSNAAFTNLLLFMAAAVTAMIFI